jgi:hypothetical protein
MMTEITDLGLHDQHHLSLNVITPAIEALWNNIGPIVASIIKQPLTCLPTKSKSSFFDNAPFENP